MEQMNCFYDSLKSPAAGPSLSQGRRKRKAGWDQYIKVFHPHNLSGGACPILFAERNWNCEESHRWAGEELKISWPPICWSEILPYFQSLPHPDWQEGLRSKVGQPLENSRLGWVTTAFRIQKFNFSDSNLIHKRGKIWKQWDNNVCHSHPN